MASESFEKITETNNNLNLQKKNSENITFNRHSMLYEMVN